MTISKMKPLLPLAAVAACDLRGMTKRSLALLTVLLLVVSAGACGGAHKRSGSTSIASSTSRSLTSLMADQDKDSTSGDYYDGDDGEIRYHGHAASAADVRAITALVKRYYEAAAARDGATACALTYYIATETLPEQYGQPPGPLWLRGANTCPTLLTRVFKHFHRQLTVPVVVTAVRVSGGRADALVGFRTLPAGFVEVRREGISWKIDGLLATALP